MKISDKITIGVIIILSVVLIVIGRRFAYGILDFVFTFWGLMGFLYSGAMMQKLFKVLDKK